MLTALTDCAMHVFSVCALNRPLDFGGAILREGGMRAAVYEGEGGRWERKERGPGGASNGVWKITKGRPLAGGWRM